MNITVSTRAEQQRITSNVFCPQYILIVDDHTIVSKTIADFCGSNNVAIEDFPCTPRSSPTWVGRSSTKFFICCIKFGEMVMYVYITWYMHTLCDISYDTVHLIKKLTYYAGSTSTGTREIHLFKLYSPELSWSTCVSYASRYKTSTIISLADQEVLVYVATLLKQYQC